MTQTTDQNASTARRRSRWALFTPWVIAVALAIACSILGYKVSSLNDALDGESSLLSNLAPKASHAQQVLELFNAPDAQRVTLTAARNTPVPIARIVYLAERGALMMEASNLKPAPAGKTYQLWILPASGASPVSAGTFAPHTQGYASMILPRLPSSVPAKGFGISLENAAGSATPTMPFVLFGE